MGHHDNYETPPDLPLFGSTKNKKTADVASDSGEGSTIVAVIKEAATAIASTLKPRECQDYRPRAITMVGALICSYSMSDILCLNIKDIFSEIVK